MRERVLRLRGKVDQDAAIGFGSRGFDDGVEAFISVHHDGRSVAGIKAHQRTVRFVGVEAEKRTFVVDQILREDACDQRFADAALFAADEVNVSHGFSLG